MTLASMDKEEVKAWEAVVGVKGSLEAAGRGPEIIKTNALMTD